MLNKIEFYISFAVYIIVCCQFTGPVYASDTDDISVKLTKLFENIEVHDQDTEKLGFTRSQLLKGFNPGSYYRKDNSVPINEDEMGCWTVSQKEQQQKESVFLVDEVIEEDSLPLVGEEEKVLDPDNDRRHPIDSPETQWPYRAFGRLHMQFVKQEDGETLRYSAPGTGVLVGPCHVLTAGHNVYDWSQQLKWATSVTFHPAGQERRIIDGRVLLCLEQWTQNRNRGFDLGMVILDQPIGLELGWLGILVGLEEKLRQSMSINVFGYPQDKFKEQEKRYKESRSKRLKIDRPTWQMWGMSSLHKGEKLEVEYRQEQIVYDIDTEKGTSGAAVWGEFAGDNDDYIIGIHAYNEGSHNTGTRLTAAKFKRIIEWIECFQYVGNALDKAIQQLTDNKCTELELKMNLSVLETRKKFFEALSQNSSVQTLNLSGSKFKIEGLVCKALKNHPTLTTLMLQDTEINDAGLTTLGSAFKKSQSLTSIDMSNNQITNAGADELIRIRQKNTKLRNINLSDNKVSGDKLEEISKVLQQS